MTRNIKTLLAGKTLLDPSGQALDENFAFRKAADISLFSLSRDRRRGLRRDISWSDAVFRELNCTHVGIRGWLTEHRSVFEPCYQACYPRLC